MSIFHTPEPPEVVKEFPVTGTATAVDLLFCIATSKDSAGVSQDGAMMSDPFNSALGSGQFSATLYYRDSSRPPTWVTETMSIFHTPEPPDRVISSAVMDRTSVREGLHLYLRRAARPEHLPDQLTG